MDPDLRMSGLGKVNGINQLRSKDGQVSTNRSQEGNRTRTVGGCKEKYSHRGWAGTPQPAEHFPEKCTCILPVSSRGSQMFKNVGKKPPSPLSESEILPRGVTVGVRSTQWVEPACLGQLHHWATSGLHSSPELLLSVGHVVSPLEARVSVCLLPRPLLLAATVGCYQSVRHTLLALVC